MGNQTRNRRNGPLVSVLIAIIVLLVAALVLVLVLRPGETAPEGQPLPTESSGTEPSAEPPHITEAPEEEGLCLRGTVADAVMGSLVVAGEDGQTYAFDKSAIQVVSGETGILIGNPVTVRYTGTLDPAKPVQDVYLLSIVVEDAPAAPEQTPALPPAETTEARAQALLAQMSLEQKVGQMFVVRCPAENAAQIAADYHLGGYILFTRDFEGKSREQVIEDIESYQAAAELPLLIGVDEEGGTVNRVSWNPELRSSPFQSPQDLYQAGGFEGIRADTLEKCALLSELGINLNLAPVCDLSQDPADFIYDRAFGKGAQETATYVETVVSTMAAENMGVTLKHFPGYGNNVDTHTGIAYDERPYETFLNADFLPFRAGIAAGADMVLVSHNIVNCMDASQPASLSPRVHEILREELGFRGVVLTDDLAMDGVRDFAEDSQVAVMAVLAGNDVLCCTDFETQYPAVLAAAETGEIPQSRLDESVLRILEMKISLGLL